MKMGLGISLSSPMALAAAVSPLAIYAVLGFAPPLVADFENEVYAKAGEVSTFNGLFTHTGASLRTMVDSTGVVKWAPHNLLLRSEEFDSASWGKNAQGDGVVPTVTANAGTAPDGTMTADRVQFSRGTSGSPNRSRVQQTPTLTAGSHTFSVWVRSFDGTDQALSILNASATGSANIVANNTWQLLTVTQTAVAGTNNLWIGLHDSLTTNLTADVLLWGASIHRSDLGGMVNNPDRGDSYVPTTTAARFLPRRGHHVWSGSAWVNEGLLLESEARTNLLLNSGTLSTQSLTPTAVAHTLSFTGTGTVTLSGSSTAGPLVGTGTGEGNRVNLTFTPTAAELTLTVSGTVTNAQLEIGSTPSSFILTAGATVTRVAETLTIAGADMPYSATAMSFQMEGRMTYADNPSNHLLFGWSLNGNNLISLQNSTNFTPDRIRFQQAAASVFDVVQDTTGVYSAGVLTPFNLASRNGATFINGAIDGTALTADTTPTALPALGSSICRLMDDNVMGTIRQFRAWDADITDAGIEAAST